MVPTDVIPEGYTPIYTMDDLVAVNKNPDGNYILMNDIDLTEATAEGGCLDTGHGWTPLDKFSGVFDGNGKRIIGMRIDGSFFCAGLFLRLSHATIKNLGMVGVNINNKADEPDYEGRYTGSVAGYADYSDLENIYCTGIVKVEEGNAYGLYSGGLAGYSDDGTFRNCYNTVMVYNGSSGGSAICGCGGILYNCYNASAESDMFFTYNSGYGRINDCYYLEGSNQSTGAATALTDYQMRSKDYFKGFDFENTWVIDPYSNHPYPQLRSCPQTRIDSLEVTNLPEKTVYNQGEALDLEGATLKIIYEDELEQEVLLTKDMLGSYNMMEVGKQSIPVEYCGLAKTSFDITINEIPVETVQLSATELSIMKGKTETLVASVNPSNATNANITWNVESGDSVTVDNTGKITAIKKGVSTVRATSNNGKYAECVVNVQIPCIMLQLDNYDVTLNKGDTCSVMEVIGYKMSPLDCTDSVSWKSSNDKVLMIDESGTMTCLAAGKVIVTGLTSSGTSAAANVTVQRNINEFTVTGIENKYHTGKAIKQKFSVTDGTVTLEENVDYKVSYQSNTNVGTAKVTITGMTPYIGTIEKTFEILAMKEQTDNKVTEENIITAPARAKIKNITSGKKKLTVSWKKVKGAKGYKIQISPNKSFKGKVKTYNVSSTTLKKVCKSLKAKKTYYVRVAAYCNNEKGEILTGKYSKVIKQTTK